MIRDLDYIDGFEVDELSSMRVSGPSGHPQISGTHFPC